MKLSFGTIFVTEKAKKLILQIVESERVSSGKYVREFEDRFAQLVGVKEAVAVSSGTDAIALALAVLYDFGANRGDEVILPALSFAATGNAVLQAGFKPVFIDIDRKTLNINVGKIENAITEKTIAILPVHLMGKPAEMDRINRIAKRHKLYVIEDAAEAHGAIYKDRNVGRWGDMAAYSLYVAHIITTAEGGIVVTDRRDFAEILRSLRRHGVFCKCKECILSTGQKCRKRFSGEQDRRFLFERIGYSSKMNELEAAVGIGNLELYSEVLEKRRNNLKYLQRNFTRFSPIIETIKEEPYERISPHAFPIIVSQKARFTRDGLAYFLSEKSIDSRNLFSSMPTQCLGFKFLGYKLGQFPNAEFIGNNGLQIGIHRGLDYRHLDYLIDTVEEFFKKCSKRSFKKS